MTSSHTFTPKQNNFNNMVNITQEAKVAATWLQAGELLAYPTESVWGIGCDAYNKAAVERILAIKKRPRDKGMIVITDSIERIEPLLMLLPEARRQQVIDSWCLTDANASQATEKQAHTWLFPVSKDTLSNHTEQSFPTWITGKHQSIAVRVINHPLIAELCASMVSSHNPYGLVVSTSCNPSGEAPATTLQAAYDYFGSNIKYLNGNTLNYTLPSQIRDGLTGQIIR